MFFEKFEIDGVRCVGTGEALDILRQNVDLEIDAIARLLRGRMIFCWV